MGSYRTYLTSPPDAGGLSPTFLLQAAGVALLGGIGDVLDAAADQAKLAAQANMPLVAPTDALGSLGLERQMPQGPTESIGLFAARLRAAWTSWPFAGTPLGLLSSLASVGYANVFLAQSVDGLQFTVDANGNVVRSTTGSWTPTFVGDPFWSRFDVLFPSPLPASWQSSGVPASNSNEANFIRSLISAWKPAFATCNRIIIVTSGKVWGYPAAQAWGAGTGTWGGSTTTVWDP